MVSMESSQCLIHLIKKADGSTFAANEIHLRQGDMDGACGPYALAMALIVNEFIVRDDVYCLDLHGNNKFLRLLNHLQERRGKHLFKSGTTVKHLVSAINEHYGAHVEGENLSGDSLNGRSFRDFVVEHVTHEDGVHPVILGIEYSTVEHSGHWVLVVGCEYDEQGVVDRFLVLDPGYEGPRGKQTWNATIDARGSGSVLPYRMEVPIGETRVAFIDALAMWRS